MPMSADAVYLALHARVLAANTRYYERCAAMGWAGMGWDVGCGAVCTSLGCAASMLPELAGGKTARACGVACESQWEGRGVRAPWREERRRRESDACWQRVERVAAAEQLLSSFACRAARSFPADVAHVGRIVKWVGRACVWVCACRTCGTLIAAQTVPALRLAVSTHVLQRPRRDLCTPTCRYLAAQPGGGARLPTGTLLTPRLFQTLGLSGATRVSLGWRLGSSCVGGSAAKDRLGGCEAVAVRLLRHPLQAWAAAAASSGCTCCSSPSSTPTAN
jgi:hypothetical protein